MPPEQEFRPLLAPLQRRMLRDSLANPTAGNHVEQLDLVFAGGVPMDRVIPAWQATVAATEALRIAFSVTESSAWEFVLPAQAEVACGRPGSWDRWLAEDRRRPLLTGGEVPWRVMFRPDARRFIWTFHHALLDGRSITRVLRSFLARLAGGEPEMLVLPRWLPPSRKTIAQAEAAFRALRVAPVAVTFSQDRGTRSAGCCLGNRFVTELAHHCARLEVTSATALIWCWGHALAQTSGTSAVWIEQVRAGAPQSGTAGFTMNTLPVEIRRNSAGDPGTALRNFRDQLLALRQIESVSPADFDPGVYPDLDGPETSVVMIEHGTLRHLVGFPEIVESLELIEPPGQGLAASAHIAPDLHLRVDGPENEKLLDAWCASVLHLINGPV